MWLGEEYLNTPIDLDEYRNNRKIRRADKKGKHKEMNYLKVSYTKKFNEFPTNKEFNVENYAVMRVRLTGDDELFIAQLNSVEKRNPETGEMEALYTPTEVLIKLLAHCLTEWSFADEETSEPYAITEENIRGLLREDFDYLALQFNSILSNIGGTKPAEEDATPTDLHENISVEEKKSLTDGSKSENDSSESVLTEPEG